MVLNILLPTADVYVYTDINLAVKLYTPKIEDCKYYSSYNHGIRLERIYWEWEEDPVTFCSSALLLFHFYQETDLQYRK